MKKTMENRYPHSATLFKFCKQALEMRYEGNVKVIDQDVGAILGYDPADCSHWKKGKKNIRALSTIRNIADHLKIDDRLLINIASGRVTLEEALFEYKGYGNFTISNKLQDSIKKDFFQNPDKWRASGISSLEDLFHIRRDVVAKAAQGIIQNCNFNETPVYVPEILTRFPNITLKSDPSLDTPYKIIEEQEKTSILHKDDQSRPYLRFLVIKTVFNHMLSSNDPLLRDLKELPQEINTIHANIFANLILVPDHLLAQKVAEVDCRLDIVGQLAQIFWVSHAMMNRRLRDYMDNLKN